MVIGMIVAVLALIVTVTLLTPYLEMRMFNAKSETKVSYWDAMFLDLELKPD
jgi:hypothetical protein